MPLELEFRKTARSPCGTISKLRQAIAAALPEARFSKDPPEAVMLQRALEQKLDVPVFIQEHLENSEGPYRGDYEGDRFSLEFYFGSRERVDSFFVNVRGTGDALKAVASIAACTGWKAVHLATVLLATGVGVTEADWQGFQGWRDQSIKTIKGEPGAPPNAAPPHR